MAGANVTKKSLAAAMKELAEEIPFPKITVEDICEKCGLNRTSFYYHFKDKYDLANWIFDTEFLGVAEACLAEQERGGLDEWALYYKLSDYLYENRGFYSNALQVKGQNSMAEHFRELCRPVLRARLKQVMGEEPVHTFHVESFTDAFLCAIERWITDKDCMAPEKFVELLRSCMNVGRIFSEQDPVCPEEHH